MTPSELKTYVNENRRVTLTDLSTHFQSDPQAVKAAMQIWIKKGLVNESKAQVGCSKGCCQCKPEDITIYQWLD